MDPFEVLGVNKDTTDEQIRAAYLGLVRRYPPETHQRRFADISEAYETIKTEKLRLNYLLFSKDAHGSRPLDALVTQVRLDGRAQPPSFQNLMKKLRDSQRTRMGR